MLKKLWYKIYDKLNYAQSYMVTAAIKNHETFADMKDKYLGQDVALCGAGPSLQKYKPLDAVHFALNRALLNENVKYDYLIADDWDGIDFIQDKVTAYPCTKFFGHQIGDYKREIPETFVRKNNARRYYTDSFMVRDGYCSKLVCDIDCRAIGNMANIAMSAMQILLFTNPRTLYIVGCDASAGHFTQEGVSKEKRAVHEKDLKMAVSGNRAIETWHEIKQFADAYYPDVRIVSVNPVGLKGIFEDIYQD